MELIHHHQHILILLGISIKGPRKYLHASSLVAILHDIAHDEPLASIMVYLGGYTLDNSLHIPNAATTYYRVYA